MTSALDGPDAPEVVDLPPLPPPTSRARADARRVAGYLTVGAAAKPAGAWTGEQVADFMFDSLVRGDFYILCPDNDVPRSLDERRILWAAGDIVENRPALSRWHPDYGEAFAKFAKGK